MGDVSAEELIAEYEKRFGKIQLTERDFSIPLSKKLPLTMLAKNANVITLDYRNANLAKLIHSSRYDNIVVLYDYKHSNGLISELMKIDSSYTLKSTFSSANKSSFLQVVSADSLRRSTNNYIIEDGYIDQINQYMNVRLSLKNYFEFFSLNSNNTQYDIETNSGPTLKFSADYKSISVWYNFTPTDLGLNTQESEKGKTGGFNFGFGVIKKNWFNNFNFRYIEGFYLNNTKDFLPNWKVGDAYIQKPNMRYAALEGTTGYKFNSKYSLRSINSQTERQLKSVGSFIASINYRFYQLNDEQSPLFDSLLNSDNYEIGFNFGYNYNFVFYKNFYLSIGAHPGFGYIYSNVNQKTSSLATQRTSHNSAVFRLSGQTGIGYNGERLCVGVYADFSGGSFLKQDVPIINTDFRNLYQFFIGYRFEVSKNVRANRMY